MKKIAQGLLDWQRIHDWATSQPKGSIVGKSCANGDCPLARYLEAQTGQAWSVGPAIRTLTGKRPADETHLDKPVWVQELIYAVDMSNGDRYEPVTKEQFLNALQEVKKKSEAGVIINRALFENYDRLTDALAKAQVAEDWPEVTRIGLLLEVIVDGLEKNGLQFVWGYDGEDSLQRLYLAAIPHTGPEESEAVL